MGIQDWIVTGVVVIAIAYSIRRLIRRKDNMCNGACPNCSKARKSSNPSDKECK